MKILRAGARSIDVGANAGAKTAELLRAGASFVAAVEPQPALAGQLAERFRTDGRVEVVAAAVGPSRGEVTIRLCGQADTIASCSPRWCSESRFARRGYTWSQAITVPQVTLDELVSRFAPVDFIKVDVEGYETEVLAGLTQAVPCLSFEYHQEFLADAQHCIERLARLGFAEFTCSDGESPQLAVPWASASDLLAFLGGRASAAGERQWDWWGDVYAREKRGA